VSTHSLAFDAAQHRHPSHTSNGSYDAASAVLTDDDRRYTTCFTTGT
jgi:hypothetical protein